MEGVLIILLTVFFAIRGYKAYWLTRVPNRKEFKIRVKKLTRNNGTCTYVGFATQTFWFWGFPCFRRFNVVGESLIREEWVISSSEYPSMEEASKHSEQAIERWIKEETNIFGNSIK